jgi:hypothetical protein
MRSIPFPGKAPRPGGTAPRNASSSDSAAHRRNVVSLAGARARLRTRKPGTERASAVPTDAAPLDLEGLDLDRLTPGARQLYWFNLNNYARHLFAAASDLAMREGGHSAAPVTPNHLRDAERRRLGAVRHREALLGAGFLLDALQILGAATCGALATQPDVAGEYGPVALVVALAATISIFLLREVLYARADS